MATKTRRNDRKARATEVVRVAEEVLTRINARMNGARADSTPRGTGKWCTSCRKGIVVAKPRPVFDPTSPNLFRLEDSYHCEKCGVMYAFPPRS